MRDGRLHFTTANPRDANDTTDYEMWRDGDHSARLKELRIVPVNPALAEKLDEYAKQLRSIFGS